MSLIVNRPDELLEAPLQLCLLDPQLASGGPSLYRPEGGSENKSRLALRNWLTSAWTPGPVVACTAGCPSWVQLVAFLTRMVHLSCALGARMQHFTGSISK